jgi:hypothetical protein
MFAHLGSFILLVVGGIVGFILFMSLFAGLVSLGCYLQNILPFAGLTVLNIPVSTALIFVSFLLFIVGSYLTYCSTKMTDAYKSKLFQIAGTACLFDGLFVIAFFFPIFSEIATV